MSTPPTNRELHRARDALEQTLLGLITDFEREFAVGTEIEIQQHNTSTYGDKRAVVTTTSVEIKVVLR